MNRKLYLVGLLALGGSICFAADPATPPVVNASAPTAPVPTPAPAPAPAPASAVVPDPAPVATPVPAPTLPDKSTLQGIFLKMGFESATKNWAGLKDDVAQLKPFHDQLSPSQQNILDTATAALTAHGITVPDAAAASGLVSSTTQPATADGTTPTPTPDTGTSTTAPSTIAAPTAPADPEAAAHALASKTRNDIIALPFNPKAMQADAAHLSAALKSTLTPQTQTTCQQALNAAVVRLLTRVKNEIHDNKLADAQGNLNQMSALTGLPDDVTAEIAAVQTQLTNAAAVAQPKKKKK